MRTESDCRNLSAGALPDNRRNREHPASGCSSFFRPHRCSRQSRGWRDRFPLKRTARAGPLRRVFEDAERRIGAHKGHSHGRVIAHVAIVATDVLDHFSRRCRAGAGGNSRIDDCGFGRGVKRRRHDAQRDVVGRAQLRAFSSVCFIASSEPTTCFAIFMSQSLSVFSSSLARPICRQRSGLGALNAFCWRA